MRAIESPQDSANASPSNPAQDGGEPGTAPEDGQALDFYGIGGSQAAAAVGEHRYYPQVQLWEEQLGLIPGFEGNEFTYWGKAHEPTVRKRYEENHGVIVEVPPASLYHPEVLWARMTPDGFVVRYLGFDPPRWVHGLEIKTAGYFAAEDFGAEGTDHVPREYIFQCIWYLWIANAIAAKRGWPSIDRWDLAVLVGGDDYREYTITRDLDTEALLVAQVTAFWNDHILAKVPPQNDGSTEFSDYLARKHPWSFETFAEQCEQGDKLAASLRDIRSDMAGLKAEESILKNEFRDLIGEESGIETGEGRITWKQQRGRVASGKVIAALDKERRQLAAEIGGSALDTLKPLDEIQDEHRGVGPRPILVPRKWSKDNG